MDFVWKPPGGRRTLSTQQSRYESKTPHIGALGSKVTNLSPRGTSDSVHSTISMWILNSYNAISSPVTGHNLSQLFFGPPQPIVFLTPNFVDSLTNIFLWLLTNLMWDVVKLVTKTIPRTKLNLRISSEVWYWGALIYHRNFTFRSAI